MKETNPKHWLPGVEGELIIKEEEEKEEKKMDQYKFKVGDYIITITATEINSVTINYDVENKPVPGSFRTIGGGGDGTGKSNWNEIKFGSNHTTGEGGSGARDVPAGGGGYEVIVKHKLSAMTANRNALREEIEGLQLFINSLQAELGRPPKFQTEVDKGRPE
jgi:hypothetical protein